MSIRVLRIFDATRSASGGCSCLPAGNSVPLEDVAVQLTICCRSGQAVVDI